MLTEAFKGKRVLITAGPTWVAIDPVRVISNIASGETGIYLARRLSELGARVTLLCGPASAPCTQQKYKLVRFSFYDELSRRITEILRGSAFDIIIHSAAVSDFKPERAQKGKIRSGSPLRLSLRPLPKISVRIARLKKKALLVMFKLETGLSDKELLNRAYKSLRDAGADLIVANQLDPYRAFILNARGEKVTEKLRSKQKMSDTLIELLGAK